MTTYAHDISDRLTPGSSWWRSWAAPWQVGLLLVTLPRAPTRSALPWP